MGSSRVYLDHAATTDVLDSVIDAVTSQMRFGKNPSSLHSAGRSARSAVEEARYAIAKAVGSDPAEIIFTSGGTEADNLAVKGLFWKRQEANPAANKILVSSIEHHAIADTVEWLEKHEGAEPVWVDVDSNGVVSVDQIRDVVEENPDSIALITVMWANNEMGALQPIKEIAEIAQTHGIPMHTDAVQAFGAVPVNFHESGVTTMAISGHKIGGPMGVGALIATRAAAMTPVLHGGGQERSVRSGTIDAPSIAGFGVAAAEVSERLAEESIRIAKLRNYLVDGVRKELDGVVLRGPAPESNEELEAGGVTRRLPNNAHFTFEGCEGDSLLFLLDMAGVESSTGSACNAGVPRPSTVLLAMGLDEVTARGAQRFTLGHSTTQEDIDKLLEVLPGAVEQAKKAGMANHTPEDRWH